MLHLVTRKLDDIPEFVKVNGGISLVDDIRLASKFTSSETAAYYLKQARDLYPNAGLHLTSVPDVIIADNDKNIIERGLTSVERQELESF